MFVPSIRATLRSKTTNRRIERPCGDRSATGGRPRLTTSRVRAAFTRSSTGRREEAGRKPDSRYTLWLKVYPPVSELTLLNLAGVYPTRSQL